MNNLDRVQEILGDEFDIREDKSFSWLFEIRLVLSASTRIHKETVLTNSPSDVDMLVHERDRILISFKHKLTELLWKYLGEVPQ